MTVKHRAPDRDIQSIPVRSDLARILRVNHRHSYTQGNNVTRTGPDFMLAPYPDAVRWDRSGSQFRRVCDKFFGYLAVRRGGDTTSS